MKTTLWRTLLRLVLAASLVVLAVGPSAAAAASLQPRAAPLSAAFLRYRTDLEQRHALGLDMVPGFRPGLVPSPVRLAVSQGTRLGSTARASYPSSYDLRDDGRVSPVRDQDPYGTCWAFATFGSLESCLLPGVPADFSEDNVALNAGFDNGGDPYDNGGNYDMSTAYLIRWSGPVDEIEDAYGDSFTPSGLTADAHVQEVLYVPGGTSGGDTASIKSALITYGAVATSILWDDACYNEATAAYFYGGGGDMNHAVTIVGWDDGLPASEFASSPPAGGAWLVKNSWGTRWGRDGYFWISYYDSLCGSDEVANAVFVGAEPTSDYGGIYSYDPLGQTGTFGYSSATAWEANVFNATRTDTVAAVGFFTHVRNESYAVYAGASLQSLQPEGSGSVGIPGFHTVRLSSPLPVTGGRDFVVAVRLTSPGDDYPLAVEYAVPGYSSAASAQPGQSYTSSSGSTWNDLTGWNRTANVCLKAYTSGSGAAPSPTPTPTPTVAPTPTPTSTPTPAPAADDDVPGVAVPASPFGGSVSLGSDSDDVFGIVLKAGQTLAASVTGPPGSDIRLYLRAPGTASVKSSDAPYEAVAQGGYPCGFTFTAAQSGTHYLDVRAAEGGGDYTVSYSVTSSPPDDTIGPVCAARNVTVKRGRVCRIYFKVYDALSAQVTTDLAITTGAGVVKKSWSWGFDKNSAAWWYTKCLCRLPKGAYRIVVTGKDLAGNSASVVGRATLTVK